MKDKRIEPRICTAFTAKCVDLQNNKNVFYTTIKDLSPRGIQILYDKQLPLGKDFKISINLIHDIADAKVKVAWNSEKPTSETYCIGLKFLEIKEKSKNKLDDFIDTIYLDTLFYS